MVTEADVVIVGSGHGGASAAIALRQQKFSGSIMIIGEEAELPYERPPLSKEYMAGERPFERILIRPEAYWQDKEVTLLPGRRVIAVEPEEHRAHLNDGGSIAYHHLIWAGGGSPRRLACSGRDFSRVHSVRNRMDVDRIASELPGTKRVVVIGGGYIGLEAAAVLSKLGKEIVIVEALPRVLSRVAGEPVSKFIEAEHRSHGVNVRTGTAIESIEGRNGIAVGVNLQDGEFLSADMVICGIGIIPEVQPLIQAGAAGGDGVDIDEHCKTTLADIYAIGDCAAHENRYAGNRRLRLESVQNASDQAAIAASSILGRPLPYDAVPWFWSNQYDIRLQTVGLAFEHDEVVVRGKPDDRTFSVAYLRNGRVLAIDCVNCVKDYVQGRALVAAGSTPPRDKLADASIPLKSLVS